MSGPDYRRPPELIDMSEENDAIRRAGLFATVVCPAAFIAAYFGLPVLIDFPTETADRLAFAGGAGMFIMIWILAGVMLVSTARRRSPADIGGAAARAPSPEVAIKVAFLQNTLEQAVLTLGFFFALAAVAGGDWLALLPATILIFSAGRILFYVGYPRGAKGRALGMTLTMMPVLFGYPLVLVLMAARLF